MRHRYAPKKRREFILEAAILLAARPGGWANLTRTDVAQQSDCSDGLVSQYFGTMKNLKHVVMVTAIKRENLEIVAQGFASGYLTHSSLSAAMKDKIAKYLVHGA